TSLPQVFRSLAANIDPRPHPAPAESESLKEGGGLHRCLACARYFVDSTTLKTHFRSKDHKKRYEGVRRGLVDRQACIWSAPNSLSSFNQAKAAERGALQSGGGRKGSGYGLLCAPPAAGRAHRSIH
uniref:Zinc finger protein 593 n=1 Tax=Panthera tigris altaica TaxID=74533 RepID=A0A8C9M8K8_PANTA